MIMQLTLAAWTTKGWEPGLGDPTPQGYFTVAHYFVACALCLWAALAARRAPKFGAIKLESALFWWVFFLFVFMLGVNKQLDLQSAVTYWGKAASIEQGWYDERDEVKGEFLAVVAVVCVVAFGGFVAVTLPYWYRNLRGLLGWITSKRQATVPEGPVPDIKAVRRRARLYAVFGIASSMLVLIGSVFLLRFVMVRSTSLHEVDTILKSERFHPRMVQLLITGDTRAMRAEADGLVVRGTPMPFRMNTMFENAGIALLLISALLAVVRIRMQRRTIRKLTERAQGAAPSGTPPPAGAT